MQKHQEPLKLGILSMQRVPNYGSFLQAFALLHTIKKLRPDVDVLFIDIKPEILFYEKLYCYIRKFGGYILKGNFFKSIQRCLYIAKQLRMFKKYQREYLNLTDEHHWDIYFGTIVIGSDEVFNCLQRASWGRAKSLLGDGLNTDNVITYAASCGSTAISGVEKISLAKDIEKGFRNIKRFSVRDENTYQFVKYFACKDAIINLDPVFLFDFDIYTPAVQLPKRKFILLYSYSERFNKKEEIIAIRKFADENDLDVISIFGYQSWCYNNIILGPFEVLAYFKRASYIITDTFHGTVFAIKYNKLFVSFIRHNRNDTKLQYLLDVFELHTRKINNTNELSNKLKQKINYEYIKKIIDKHVQISIRYLDENL